MKAENKIHTVAQGEYGNFRKTEEGFEFLVNIFGVIKLFRYHYSNNQLTLIAEEEVGTYDEGSFISDGIIFRSNSKLI